MIEAALLPTSNKNVFFARRREFFDLLDKKTQK
jgi:hypothetical protein